jgi:nucleoside-diphosphate-sugar epimerase
MPPVTAGRVAIFGAGGPVGAAAAQALREHYTLRLTDLRPIAETAAGKPQSPGAPLPEPLPPPHECRIVDVTDYAQVLDAARGMDALVNCTVVRPDPVLAFQVNMLGAYHVARAAVECGIRRIVHTGPQAVLNNHQADYYHDWDVHDDVPQRPGSGLYSLTKYLGEEITRVFAERHGLEVAEFVYCAFRPADRPEEADGSGVFCFTTAWEDTGEPFLHALRAPGSAFERPLERFTITSRLPQGKFGDSGKAARLLGWEPRHDFRRLWTRPAGGADSKEGADAAGH